MTSEHRIEWDDTKVSRLWDYYSRTPPYADIYFSKVFGERILRNSGLSFERCISVLDFGSGPGFIWEHVRKLGIRWDYAGLDFSSDSVRKLNEKAAGHSQFKGGIHVRQLPTEFPDNHFDAVLLIEVVEHLRDEHLSGTLEEIWRVLKPGGVVVITTPNEEDLTLATKFCPECGAIFHEWQHVRSWSATTLSDYLQSSGFALRFATPIDFSEYGLLGTLVAKARRIVTGRHKRPHLIASFEKSAV